MYLLELFGNAAGKRFLLFSTSLCIRRKRNIAILSLFSLSVTIYVCGTNFASLKSYAVERRMDDRQLVSQETLSRQTLGGESTLIPVGEKGLQNNIDQKDITRDQNCSELPSQLVGDMGSDPKLTPTMKEVENHAGESISMGGCFEPPNCRSDQKVAIIIPFKDRDAHLRTLLYYLHPMLKRQRLHYCVYVAEQFDNGQFNKAMIMNAAFEETLKLDDYDCVIFHDVDMIPENDTNLYRCGDQPRHLSPAIDKFEYEIDYGTDFGGVIGITVDQYRKANGHSNRFWGWGGEDNDMECRIKRGNMSIIPSSADHGRYKMIKHIHPWKFSETRSQRMSYCTPEALSQAETDGLSDLQYRKVDVIRQPLFTKLVIDIRRIEVTQLTLYIDGKPAMEMDLQPGECRYEKIPGKVIDYSISLVNRPEAKNVSVSQGKYLSGLQQAKELCNKLYPECAGVLQEDDRYTLRKSGVPRNIFTSNFAPPLHKSLLVKTQIAYVRYCPGDYSNFKPYNNVIQCSTPKACKHTYSFYVQFKILKRPEKQLFYSEDVHLELDFVAGQDLPVFNSSELNETKSYGFRTPDIPISFPPGCRAIESRITDPYHQPYLQWNWWLEMTSGDEKYDNELRSTHWMRVMAKKAASHSKKLESAWKKSPR